MRLPRATLLAFAAPALPLTAMLFPVYVFLAEFYSSQFGMSLAFIGTTFIAVRIFDAVSDPAIGILSDTVTTRWGRRRVWLVLGTPIVMLAAWFLFVPGEQATRTDFIIWLFLLTLGWTFVQTPYLAWAAEMTGDYAERGRIAVWRDATGLLGTIIAIILFAAGGQGAAGMMLIALLVVIGLPLAVGLCLARVPEPRDYSRSKTTLASLLGVLRAEPRFLRLLIAYFINGASNALPATLFLFFVGARLEAPGQAGLLLMLYFGAAVLAAPLWSYLVQHFSKHRIWCCAMIYAAVIFFFALFLGPGDVIAFAIISVLSGAALGADLALPSALQADLVDIDTQTSGAQRTGAFFAIWSLATKFALALTGGAALILLDWIGFDAQAQNSAGALLGLSLLYALAPIVLKLIAVAMMWNFPLSMQDQAQTRARIEAGS